MEKNIENIKNWLKEQAVDAVWVTDPKNVAYFTGYQSEPHERILGLAIFKNSDPFLFTPKLEVDDVKASSWPHAVYGYSDMEDPFTILSNHFKKCTSSTKKLAIEKTYMSLKQFENLQARFPDTTFVPIDEKMAQIRAVKTKTELKILKEAARLADEAVQIGIKEIAEGKKEIEIVAKIEYEMKKKGVDAMSFETMVLTGENTASPHGTPGDSKIQKGDFVLFDLGVVYQGYCSDITRTVAFGEISAEQKKIYHTVLEAQAAALENAKPGVQACTLDLAARNVIEKAGYGLYFPHRLGHGLGRNVHEFPSITSSNDTTLSANMVFTVEPGIYVPYVAGARIEDDIVLTENGYEALTEFPKELLYIK